MSMIICGCWKKLDDGCVARCDQDDMHKGDHLDSVIDIAWLQGEPAQPSASNPIPGTSRLPGLSKHDRDFDVPQQPSAPSTEDGAIHPWMENVAKEFYANSPIHQPLMAQVQDALVQCIARHCPAPPQPLDDPRVQRLVEAFSELTDRFPDNDTIEELKADSGYGHRRMPMMGKCPTDADVLRWRKALAPFRKEKQP